MFDAKNMMCMADPRHGRYLSAAALFRGSMSLSEVESRGFSILYRSTSNFAEWIPTNLKMGVWDVPLAEEKCGATLIANSTAI